MADHPDFLAVPEAHRWTGKLDKLGQVLREQAWKAKGKKVWYVLPGGACVTMRVLESGPNAFRKELRISRREKLASPEAIKKWAQECKVFRSHLGCDFGWHTQTFGGKTLPPLGDGVVEVGDPTEWVTMEDEALRAPKARPEPLVCVRCGKPAEPGSEKYKEILCNRCATELGAAEVAQHQLKLEG